MNELISIIVPIYNVSEYIDRCLESLLKQTYENLEIIVVDDGSTDNSVEICNYYATKYLGRLRVIHTDNCGVSVARNTGLKIAKGEYITFVDGDDWVEPDMLETLLYNLYMHNADISSCGMKEDYDNGESVLQKQQECICISQKQMFHEVLCNKYVYGYVWNKLFKKELIQDIVFDKSLFIQEDMDFVMKYLKNCKKCVYTMGEYYHYRKRRDSATGEADYNPKNLSMVQVYQRAISIYQIYCPQDEYIVEKNYLKININILGRMKRSKYYNEVIQSQIKDNIIQYYKKVLREKKNSIGSRLNIIMSYHFPGMMLKLKQKLILQRRKQ